MDSKNVPAILNNSPEVLEQVKSIGIEDADDLAVMNYLMQVKIATELVKFNSYWRLSNPKTERTFLATAETKLKKMTFDFPCLSVVIRNNGPGSLYVRYNELSGDITNEIPTAAGSSTGFSTVFPTLKCIYYQATATSELEISLEEGYRE